MAQLLGNAGFFVAVLLVARGLGPDGRGTIAFVVVTALVLARLANIGLAEATLVFASQRPTIRPELLANALLFSAAAGSLVAGVAAGTLLAWGRSAPAGIGTIEVLVLFVGTISVTISDVADHFIIGCGKLRQRAAVTVTVPWVYALLTAAMLNSDALTVASAGFAWALATGVGAVATVSVAVSGIGFGRPRVLLLRESIRFGARAWIGNFATFLNLRVDQIVLGLIATQATLGIYAVAVNASEVLLYLPASVATALLPALANKDAAGRHEQTLSVFRVLGLITVATMVGAALIGPWLLPRVFGPAFADSVAAFLWLLPAALGYAVTKVFSSGLLASYSPGRSAAGPLVSLGVGLSLDMLLIPLYGAVGAAAAASVGFLAGGVTAMVVYKGLFPFPWKSLLPSRREVDLAVQLLRPKFGSGSRDRERAMAPDGNLPLRGASIVCLSSIDWDFLWQTHQEIMSRLAAGGNKVVFVENTGGVRSVRLADAQRIVGRLIQVVRQLVRGDRVLGQNLTIISPLLLPFAQSRISRFINERVLLPWMAARIRRIAGPDPVIYSYLPTANALQVIQLIGGARSVVVYHCVADYRQLAADPSDVIEQEHRLVQRADLVLVQSDAFAERFSANPRVHLVPIGVHLGIFDPAAVHAPAQDVRNLSGPILGYVGALHVHLDLELLIRLARAFPLGSIVLIGPTQVDLGGIRELSNVHLLGMRAHAELPALIAAFDVGLIPYRRSAYTETVNPTKLFEYLAMGCATVSTDIPDVVNLALPQFALRTAANHNDFIGHVRSAIAANKPEDRARRRELARDRDWSTVVPRVAALIAERRDAARAEETSS